MNPNHQTPLVARRQHANERDTRDIGEALVAHMAEAEGHAGHVCGHSDIDAPCGPNVLATVDWV